MSLKVTHHVTKEATTLLQVLTKSFKFTKKEADTLLRLGCIYLDELRLFEDQALEKGAHLRLYLKPTRYPVSGTKWRDRVIAEENEFIVVNKPPGIPTHATVDNWYENTLFQMRSLLGTDLFVTQRLDTPVSGLILFAKTKKFQATFNELLKSGKVKKIYHAFCENTVPTGLKIHYMEPGEKIPKRLSESKKEWDICKLNVLSSEPVERGFQNTVELLTGRTHQIRAQMSFLGVPILGDKLYGSKKKWDTIGIGLFAKELVFGKYAYQI